MNARARRRIERGLLNGFCLKTVYRRRLNADDVLELWLPVRKG
jgi:hypothetical protein